ncbi:ParA family protein [Desulfobaculum bizertense]|uniref:Chromosome partitioning protein n=1 Tax=Desulfobaculum bizertense DSM 18034 TaxID=1121442 RepID=A0A1T4WY54_9BACT|nr:ParA family protein [Desulfobaculum bizertense]UIJ39558.1 ParA family protein [Desulfobaculum bizertense]SKA82244.1 chromosome partitioning protein [Desulfobaculum bizertense DSM 18034]
MATVISFCNQKGGVAKSTSVINIAHCLAKYHSKRVLVIDTDPQHNTTLIYGTMSPFDYPLTFASVIRDEKLSLEPCIYPTKYPKHSEKTKYPTISMIPSNMDMFGLDGSGDPRSSFLALRDKLTEEIHDKFDFILIDCPPNINVALNNALAASDYYIIPVKSEDWFALKGMQQLQAHIHFIRESFNKNLNILGALITMRDNRTNLSESMSTAIASYFREATFQHAIRNNTAINRATSNQRTIFEEDPKSNGAQDYQAVTSELLERVGAQE